MKDQSKSSFIFDLIDEFQIFDSSGNTNEFTDEALQLFCEKYKQLSKQRDQSLLIYLNTTPNLFRTHLPHSKWAFSVVFGVVWYYDELILSDPVLQLINSDKSNLESRKNNLQDLLAFLKSCKESIDGGYLLFSGDDLTPDKTGMFEDESNLLVNEPQVLTAFENISALVKKPSPINNNPADNLTQVEVMYEGMWGFIRNMGMYIPPHVTESKKLGNSVYYDFSSKYQRISKEELIALNKSEMLDALKREYSKDISIVLETITNAQRLNSPVLFYRDADIIAAKNYAILDGKKTSDVLLDTSVYDCFVPYMNGVTPERLFDYRNQMPEAFKEFRYFLFELVTKTMKATDNPAEFKFKIDSEIDSLLRKLVVEMENAKKKWSIHGLVAPLAIMTGSLTLYSSGIDYSKLLSTLLGSSGIIKSFTTWRDVKADKNKASLNPTYFLWKVQQPK